MAKIQELLDNLLHKKLGRDVRQSIHDSIEQCYKDAIGHPESVAGVIEENKNMQKQLDSNINTINGRIDTILTGTVNTTKLVTVQSKSIRNNSASGLIFKISSEDNETLKSIKDKSPKILNANVIALALDGVAMNNAGIPSSYNTEITNGEYIVTVYSGSSNVAGQYLFAAVVTIAYEDTATDISSAELKDIRAGADGTVYKSAGEAVRGQIGQLKESISDLQESGNGINNAAKNILLDILKNAIYTTDQVNNIKELGKALAGDVYSITNNLTNCTSSNAELSVAKGDSYTTTIIADSKYIIDSCTVTMKGIDITDNVYSNGKIMINSVTGNVVITAVAEKGTDNLIKKFQCTSGKIGNGAQADGSTRFITPFIEVEPSTVYKHNITTILSDGSKEYNQYIESYDTNKTTLNTKQINTGGAAYEKITEHTTDAATRYIRILFNADHKNPYFGKSGEF